MILLLTDGSQFFPDFIKVYERFLPYDLNLKLDLSALWYSDVWRLGSQDLARPASDSVIIQVLVFDDSQ